MFSRKKKKKTTGISVEQQYLNSYRNPKETIYDRLAHAANVIKNKEYKSSAIDRQAAFLFILTDVEGYTAETLIKDYAAFLTEEEKKLIRETERELKQPSSEGLVAPRTFSLRAGDGRVMYSNVLTRKCSERRTFMRGGTALDLYVEPGASFRGHHWRTMLKTMYADKLPSKFDLYHARGKVDMAALVDGNMTVRGYK